MRFAAIDIGTNSVLLLVVEQRGDDLVPIVERATITRLGQGVDATRKLAPEAVTRTLDCLAKYGEELRAAGASKIAAVGTSAMRDASGGDAFRAEAKARLGVEPRVVSGREEAELTFEGALSGLGLSGPVTVFDVGGGSTEIVTGDAAGGLARATSLDIGSVRLTERHVKSDPPTAAELEAVRADVRASLERTGFSPSGALVGVAGTVTTLASYARDVFPYDASRVHGARLSQDEVVRAVGSLATMPLVERRTLQTIKPERADVIVAGGVLVAEVLAWASEARALHTPAVESTVELVVSDRGVRWGLARRLAEGRLS
ncbi:Ppx/GppA phosphatase family protein [Polyangium mundeleinium]|uniref:Ppx/GppA phosphatase family protein n=1 Tax=Polyangium mundeleinium TaxID=2995306 RepID=A0ABT5F478_9BACT|nr:Ppx/GppA phosphatase family protein [Polyangium mundeleinium]MDC0748801.1 Ppx/GppA phosphatase family protein [Polyangium mundeleinium]